MYRELLNKNVFIKLKNGDFVVGKYLAFVESRLKIDKDYSNSICFVNPDDITLIREDEK